MVHGALTPEAADIGDKVEHVNRVVVGKLRRGELAEGEGEQQKTNRGVFTTAQTGRGKVVVVVVDGGGIGVETLQAG